MPLGTPSDRAALPPRVWWILRAMVALALALVLVVSAAPLWFGGLAGGLAVALAALALMVAFGSVLAWASDRSALPIALLLLLAAVPLSRFTNPHPVRTLAGQLPYRPTIDAHFQRWFQGRMAERDAAGGGRVPVIIAHAEGGGIRAAYWTASVLAELQDENPAFARHLFAVSGVSGGALGAVVFNALVADADRLGNQGCETFGKHLCHAKFVLGEDFVSPLVAALLFPDLARVFVPIPLGPDRAGALEQGWERAWAGHVRTDRFRQPFLQLWQGDEGHRLPSLFLNATWAERGSRVVISNLRTGRYFPDVKDGLASIGQPISASVAAHLSARFPFISPPARVQDPAEGGAETHHFVDGGYFENSGAATAADILASLRRVVRDQGWDDRFYPVILSIQNSEPPQAHGGGGIDWLTELTGPPIALFNTRSARGEQARISLYRDLVELDDQPARQRGYRAARGAYVDISLDPRSAEVPLGWALARTSMQEMDAQLVKQNEPSRRMIKQLLAAP